MCPKSRVQIGRPPCESQEKAGKLCVLREWGESADCPRERPAEARELRSFTSRGLQSRDS